MEEENIKKITYNIYIIKKYKVLILQVTTR